VPVLASRYKKLAAIAAGVKDARMQKVLRENGLRLRDAMRVLLPSVATGDDRFAALLA
jgi:hypothetical protein